MDFFRRLKLFAALYLCVCLRVELAAASVSTQTKTELQGSLKDAAIQPETRQMPSLAIPVLYDTPPANGQQQPPPGFLPNLPIIGTLVGNIPGLGVGQQGGFFGPNGLGGGFNGLLGNLGLVGIAGQTTPQPAHNPGTTCPLTQKLTCHCEPVLAFKPPGGRQTQPLSIVAQNSEEHEDNSTELIAQLSNGLLLYQKKTVTAAPSVQGYFSLKLTDQKYLNIRYNVSDVDYLIKADIGNTPPGGGSE